jgi:surface antigen
MSNVKVSAVKSWMVLGKLLILLAINPVQAQTIENPRFFSYSSGPLLHQMLEFSFGWFRTLDEEQKSAYYQSITHAVMYAENGQKVDWYKKDASGYAVPVTTWPTGSGYCRRVYIHAIAFNTEKTMQRTACFDNASTKWDWRRE